MNSRPRAIAIVASTVVWILFLLFSGVSRDIENQWVLFIIFVAPIAVFILWVDEKWPRK